MEIYGASRDITASGLCLSATIPRSAKSSCPHSNGSAAPRTIISVVVLIYNEATIIGGTHRRLAAVMAALRASREVIYVNDGSGGATLHIIEASRQTERHVAVVNLSRNFGTEIAATAGPDHARSDAVIVMG